MIVNFNWRKNEYYAKKWKDAPQARLSMQKFFLKLKTIKTPKSDFDFTNNNTKSLSNIIESTKRKEMFNKKKKKKKEDFIKE